MKKFHKEHEWVTLEGNIATVGLSQYAAKQLGDITFIELPEINSSISAGDSAAFIESVKAASDVYTPLDGKVCAINETLIDKPEQLSQAPQDTWIYKLTLESTDAFDLLMDDQSYNNYIESL